MNRSSLHSTTRRTLLLFAFTISAGHAAVSSALSPAITVDTRDTSELTVLTTKLTAKPSSQGHTLVTSHSPAVGLTRNTEKPAYLALAIPRFDTKGGGWAPHTKGLGAFHGFEILYQGGTNDRIYQKIGGAPPSSSTPDTEWKQVSTNRVLSGNIREETRYFKVVFAGADAKAPTFSVRYHSARLTDGNGNPITGLDSNNDIWLIFHDKNGGHETLSALHNSLRIARRQDQVVIVDWASAATTSIPWQQPASNASYFGNIGQNLAFLLKNQGFSRQQINLVGHGWGTIVAHETASSLGGCNHIIALDPTARGAGAFNARSIRFSRISKIATSIKSGSDNQGSIGNESMATTADYSIRLLSQSHTGDPENSSFHHELPVHWCKQALSSSDAPYWPFFKKEILFRRTAQPVLPWSATGTLTGGFHLECIGRTHHDKAGATPDTMATMEKITSLAFLRNNQRIVARAQLSPDGQVTWTYRRK